MKRVWDRLRACPPWLILVMGWIVFVVYAYPGLMTKDSLDQLAEARSGSWSDAHPPMMAAIWSMIDFFISGPFGMIVLQTATFVIGGYLIARRALCERGSALAAVGLLLFPPVGAVMAVVWKDCVMAGFLMLGIGLLFDERRWVRVVALVLILLATAVRYNAFGATLPAIILLFVWREAPFWRRHARSTIVWLVTTLAAFGASSAITDRPTHLWHSSLAVQDIVGTLHYTPSKITDTSLRRAFAGAPLVVQHNIQQWAKDHYRPDSLLDIVIGPQRLFDLSLEVSAPADQRAAIEAAWKTIVKGHVIAYLRHRLQVMLATVGLAGDSWTTIKLIVTHDFQDIGALEAAGIPVGYSAYQTLVGDIYEAASTTFLFRPYMYLVIALALLVLARRQRDVLALLLSGLTIEASLFFIGPSADYRYSHWLVVTTCIAIVLLIARRYRDGDIARRSV